MTPVRSHRRLLLLGLALGRGCLIARRASPASPWFGRGIAFEDMARPPGFRRARAEGISPACVEPFAGIGGPAPAKTAIPAIADVDRDVRGAPSEGWPPGSVT